MRSLTGAPKRAAALLLTTGMMGTCAGGSLAQGPAIANLEPVRTFEAPSLVDDDDEAAMDISGIACMPSSGATRTCLVINDEDRTAQLVRLEGDRLTVTERLPLIGKKPSGSTLGEQPQAAECSEGKAKFKDFDGEAVTFAAPYFYIAGSQGCSRNSNKFRA